MRPHRPHYVLTAPLTVMACVGHIEDIPGEPGHGGRVSLPATDPDAGETTLDPMEPADAGRADVYFMPPADGGTAARPDSGTAARPAYPGVPGVSPTIGGCPVFPPDDPWNRDISSAPVRRDSAAIIANINDHGDTTLKADFGSNAQYSILITIAPATQPAVAVRLTEYPDESDRGPFPIPANARIEGGNDDHVLVVHQGSCALIELYHARYASGAWSAGNAARFDLRTNTARPRGWTSADQAGLPIAPGLVRYDEVAAGEIRHALRVTFDHTRAAWVYPATHPGGSDDATAPAMGMRLRLRAGYDISGLTGQARVIATALKRYGLFVADTGTNWYISGEADARWRDSDLSQLREIPGDAFEVIDTGAIQTR